MRRDADFRAVSCWAGPGQAAVWTVTVTRVCSKDRHHHSICMPTVAEDKVTPNSLLRTWCVGKAPALLGAVTPPLACSYHGLLCWLLAFWCSHTQLSGGALCLTADLSQHSEAASAGPPALPFHPCLWQACCPVSQEKLSP